MKKLSYRYSSVSLAIRIILSLILALAAALIVFYQTEISKKIYKWDEASSLPADFSVHFIDVGQGDSSLLLFDDGTNMLIDCGPKKNGTDLVSYISDLGITQIDRLLITHPDEDHVGGCVNVFQTFDVKSFYRPMFLSRSETEPSEYPKQDTLIYDDVITAGYNEQGCKMFYTNDALSIVGQNYTVNILYPDTYYTSTNGSSAIVLADLDGVKFLFTGDAEKAQERTVAQKYGDMIKSDVLKVGHHGASTSSDTGFLSVVQPKYAVISCGKDNKYGHPTQQTLSSLNDISATVLRTDLLGDIKLEVKQGVLYADGNGKMINITLVCMVIFGLVMLVWIIPEKKKDAPRKKDAKKRAI